MNLDEEIRGRHFPAYLLPSEKKQLFEEVEKFPENQAFYTNQVPYEGLMQGDCWKQISFIDENGKFITCKAVVLSNTCDLSLENIRSVPKRIVFSPLISLSNYREILIRSGASEAKISQQFETIRSQKISNIMYFPGVEGYSESCIALLDNVYSLPRNKVSVSRIPDLVFRLNMYGFYLFVIKLSIHFTRFQEGLDGGNPRVEVVQT